jgi:hypothetical protein
MRLHPSDFLGVVRINPRVKKCLFKGRKIHEKFVNAIFYRSF